MSEEPATDRAGLNLPDSWRVGDAVMARAYSRTDDRRRSLIKSAIAGLYAALDPGRPLAQARTDRFAAGLSRREERLPRPWHVLLLGPAVASAPQVVAVVLPAVVRRVPEVVVIRPRSRGGWPDAVLCALELAGVESVYGPSQADFRSLLGRLAQDDSGSVSCLGSAAFWAGVSARLAPGQAWPLIPPDRVGLWAEPGQDWDAQAIAFAHPGATVEVWGGQPFDLPGFTARRGDHAAFCRAGYHTVYAAADRVPDSARLRLGPGREHHWEWLGFPEDHHATRRVQYFQD